MTATTETIPGTRDLGHRLADCDTNFVAQVVRIAGCTNEEAAKVLKTYVKHKLVKRDLTNRTWNVKHGAFLSYEVLHRAINS